jgi:hypothetical protein
MSTNRATRKQAIGPAGSAGAVSARPEGIPIDELRALYPDEWIAVKVTNPDDPQKAARGTVLAHGRARGDVSDAVIEAHRSNPEICTYVFYGCPVGYSFDDLPRLLEWAEARYPDAWG